MKITTNQCRAALLTNLLVVGLAACSSTPAPWSRPDTSPWTDKHNTASSSVPVDSSVTQAPEVTAPPEALPAPTATDEAPAEEAPDTESMPAASAPTEVPPPAEYKAKSVVSDINNEQRIMALPGSYYAVQIYAASTLKSVEQYKSEHKLDNMMSVETDRDGKSIYVLVETYPTRGAAQAAASDLKNATGNAPWVRSVAGLQKVVKQQ